MKFLTSSFAAFVGGAGSFLATMFLITGHLAQPFAGGVILFCLSIFGANLGAVAYGKLKGGE